MLGWLLESNSLSLSVMHGVCVCVFVCLCVCVCVCVCVCACPPLQANVKSEVGKLVKRLCVLLNVDEDDHAHYSLYVEGASFTHLSEVRVHMHPAWDGLNQWVGY